jgi:hypothetical protein
LVWWDWRRKNLPHQVFNSNQGLRSLLRRRARRR